MARRFFPKDLLSPAEVRFYLRLKESVPEFDVLPQVCMGAIVDPPKRLTGRFREKARYAYQAKHVDFTIFDAKENRIVCLIEHDDPSHNSQRAEEKDAARDAITAEAGYRTLRWHVRDLPDDATIRDEIFKANEAGPLEYVAQPDWARAKVDSTAPAERGLWSAVEDWATAQADERPRAPRRSGRNMPSVPSVGKRTLAWVLAAVSAWALLTFALPAFSTWFVNKMAHSVGQKKPTTVAAPAEFRQVALLPRKAVVLKIPNCLVYGDAAKVAAVVAKGCAAKEVVGFPMGVTAESLGEWLQFNQGRIMATESCPPYTTWAAELAQDGTMGLGEKRTRLQELYDDALSKGCMRAPA